jgi:hypothetical protein
MPDATSTIELAAVAEAAAVFIRTTDELRVIARRVGELLEERLAAWDRLDDAARDVVGDGDPFLCEQVRDTLVERARRRDGWSDLQTAVSFAFAASDGAALVGL